MQRLIRGLSRQKRFYKLGRGLMGGNVVDLDWYFDKTIQGSFALDFAAAKKSLGKRELIDHRKLIHAIEKVTFTPKRQ